ncbi:AI-2E family transporter [Aeromicrobium sp. YIM 150415]|uniref:AI-2E family transporter n=1 Tax=Aeromicrobium sp. YIM 150415 TaxID=2803912 RepID=UPI0019665DE2|nr:AI-2E family transporter [Aeromicrobium sp. YIM 150415]MBM9462344.1 AI-2E family transporter [Aeromicrobium sp. YIM 150415]
MSTTNLRDRGRVIDEGFAQLQRWGLRIVVIAAALYVLGWVIGRTWMVWFPICLAILVATVLEPPARKLKGIGFPDALSALLTLLGFLGGVFVVFAMVIPQMIDEAPSIANSAASGLNKVQQWLTEGPFQVTEGQITQAIDTVQQWLRDSAGDISSGVFSTLGTVTNVIINLVVTLVLVFFILKDGHRFLPFVRRIGGRRVGGHLSELMGRSWGTLGGFIRTQGIVSAVDAFFIGLGLLIVGVPLAIPLAILTFFGGFIPIVGAFATGALAVLVTLVTNSLQDAIIVLLIIVAVQQLESNILSPWLQGKSMKLHAGVVLLAVTAGGSLFGITGAFLAVPVAAAVAEILRYLNEQVDLEVSPDAPSEDRRGAEPDSEGPTTADIDQQLGAAGDEHPDITQR